MRLDLIHDYEKSVKFVKLLEKIRDHRQWDYNNQPPVDMEQAIEIVKYLYTHMNISDQLYEQAKADQLENYKRLQQAQEAENDTSRGKISL